MARTFVRQDTQIRNSDAYVDNTAPSEANFETNPTEIQTDLNNIRSQLHNLLKNQAGNWWDDLNIPATLETGVQRGVNDLNDALHLLEKKRVLRAVRLLSDVTVTASTAASGTLTGTTDFANGETVTIDTKVYTFQTTLTDVDGNIQIGGTLATSLQNLYDAINLTGTPGTQYANSMTLHPTVSATGVTATTVTVTAKAQGTYGNTIATTETAANASWGGATLSGGAGGDVEILGAGELPTQTTAAVGAVTTLGTVVATATSFLTAGLDEVAGSNALSPKNLIEIVDGTTGDPILTYGVGASPAGKRIWALLQGESGLTDGGTITDTTTTRVQLSFVIANATNDDLILVDGAEMSGKTINYSYRERIRLEDLTEGDFLDTAAIDIGAGAVTPTRQNSYDNQGTTPVDVTTNATLDLEGPGLIWAIRDDLEANLFVITEGSAGGTSTVQIATDVDTFDVNAAVNDFLNGASFDTGAAGTTINVGVTPNQIDSGGALKVLSTAADLSLAAGLELNLTDSYRAGSTWSLADGIMLATSSTEWDDFETTFGEVSLLAAITAAGNISPQITKDFANVTVTTTADNDVSNADGNLDAVLGDFSLGDFLSDHDLYLNGQLLRPGANSGANNDYYPGTSLAQGPGDSQLKFEFTLKTNDVLCAIHRAT